MQEPFHAEAVCPVHVIDGSNGLAVYGDISDCIETFRNERKLIVPEIGSRDGECPGIEVIIHHQLACAVFIRSPEGIRHHPLG